MAGWNECNATIGVSSGKWYWEVLFVSTAELQGWLAGVRTTHGQVIDSAWSRGAWNAADDGYAYGIWDDGSETVGGGSMGSFTSALSGGDIIGFLLDLDSATTTFIVYVNNSLAGTLQSGLPAGQSWNPGIALANPYSGNNSIAIMNFGQDSSFAGQKTAQGNQDDNGIGDFYYDVPAGYLALCTSNLSDPSIADPTDHFNTKLYTGTGSELAITGLNFQPDFTWIKQRSIAWNHRVFDAVRGVTEELYTNVTDAEVTDAQSLKTFDSDGFTLGTSSGVNPDPASYTADMVSWNWKGDGASGGTLNQDGTIDSQVNVNTTAGFSISSYTGNNTAEATIGHGLSQTPDWVIIKDRDNDATQWVHNPRGVFDANYYGYFDDQAFSADSSNTFWYNPTASVVKVSAHSEVNASATDYIMYCFHSVEGYSKIGSYVGNGDADAPFIYTGFSPAFILLKSVGSTGDWAMQDNKRLGYNPTKSLYANYNYSESVTGYMDILSNGFKPRNVTTAPSNASGVTVMYIAFASHPFKYSNAR